jgi:hypothetical protein
VPLPSPRVNLPTFFATVFLQHHVSNTLAINVREGSVDGYLEGRPFHVLTAQEVARQAPALEDEEEQEAPVAPRPAAVQSPPEGVLQLAARAPGPYRPAEPVLLDATLALTPECLDEAGPEAWLRSLVACATRQDNQTSCAGNWLGERLLFADDVRRERVGGRELAVIRASFELAEVIGARLRRGLHYVQVSARQFRSPMLELRCE